MAIVTRYFSTTGAGAADGTSWANRAALFSAGNWSTVVTGFNFAGSDSLLCLIGPGTYSCGQQLQTSTFTNAPTAANNLFLHGCDSSGAALTPSNPGWTADTPVDWETGLPVIDQTANVATLSFSADLCTARLIKFTSSARTTGVVVAANLDWCVVVNSTSNTSAAGASGFSIRNSSVEMAGTAFDYAINPGNNLLTNVRVRATGSASSGNRRGIVCGSFSGDPKKYPAWNDELSIEIDRQMLTASPARAQGQVMRGLVAPSGAILLTGEGGPPGGPKEWTYEFSGKLSAKGTTVLKGELADIQGGRARRNCAISFERS